ncbi:MAG: ABC transporter substrate-binding protein [Desulfobacteraceae bacterium]|nr:ABC transporter substrate-binding protein [Desulfobacteraceae bacterium]
MKPIHWKIIIICCLSTLVIVFILPTKPDKKTVIVSTPNLDPLPLYSKYKFKKTDKFIRIGTQPLYMPSSLIVEALKRDSILKEELLKMGLKIYFYDFLKGDDVNFFLTLGDLDAGIGGDMPALTAASNLDIIIPAIIQRGFISIVANRQMLIEDLEGSRIGYAFGSNAHYALLTTLAGAKLSTNEVKLIPMEVTQMPDALYANKITAFSAWEPTPTIALKKYPDTTIIHQRLSFGFLYFLTDFYQRRPKAVSQILAAEIRAIRWMQAARQNLLRACRWNITAIELAFGTKIDLSVDDLAAIAMKDILGQFSNPAIIEDDLKEDGPLHRELMFLINIKKVPPSTLWTQIRQKFMPEILGNVWLNKEQFRLDEFNYQNPGDIQ